MLGMSAGNGVQGIPSTSWGGETKLRDGAYRVLENGNKIELTIENVDMDSVDSEKILEHLAHLKVIQDPTAWRVEKKDDSSGNTLSDDLWTTIIFVRLLHKPL